MPKPSPPIADSVPRSRSSSVSRREFGADGRGKTARSRSDALKRDKDAVRGVPNEKKLESSLKELRSSPRKVRAEKLAAFAALAEEGCSMAAC